MKNWGDFFLDDAGRRSCMRLLCFVATLGVLGVWVWGNARAGCYVPLGYAESGLLAALCGGKALQGYFEYGGGDD
jgi:hypothetical protein